MRMLISALLLLSSVVQAEALSIPIPEQGWTLELQAPPTPTTSRKETNTDGKYTFLANSESFMLFVFVRPPAKEGGSNKDCFDFYWPKDSGNKTIVKDSVETTSNARYHRVQYTTFLKGGATETTIHVHYYFAFAGKWVEVAILLTNPTAKASEIIAAFDKGLNYSKK